MSIDGFLRLEQQSDGDWIVAVAGRGPFSPGNSELKIVSIEFCTPGAGGGGSQHTWKALGSLAHAMALDNADAHQQGRRGQFSGTKFLEFVTEHNSHAKLKAACEAALRIKDLWLIPSESCTNEEITAEASALDSMRRLFEDALAGCEEHDA